ncbi:MAG: tRNA methyltransferase [Holosporaceae bacterium]|jgi:tRNA (cytidine/uridine-2'-O-)-methyltransferase|nr:tRNA methyltransferase [Holosporaceae bacterium]
MLRLALYHPQIPQNTGTLLRLASCLGIRLDLIRPFGFAFTDKKLRRAGMDYIKFADYKIHDSFEDFQRECADRRLVALDVGDSSVRHHDFRYALDDVLIVGSEHYGFSKEHLDKIFYRVKIPMIPSRRSLNMAISAAMVLSEAMSQLNLYSKDEALVPS